MAVNHFNLSFAVLSILICYATEIHQAHANAVQGRSCDIVRCPAGTYCVNGKCVTSCDEVNCDEGQECVYEHVDCFTSPCPPMPVCKPIVKEPTCEGVHCEPWQECVLQIVQCFTTPCPPIPTCKPIDRCALIRCQGGYKCINGNCVKEPTCVGFECEEGEECYLQNVTCVQAPCLPVPACRPILTCATINCIRGTVCVDNKCIPKPTCNDVKCDPGEECLLVREDCINPPCPPPQPVCRPSCANILCLAPSNCVDGQCVPITCENEEKV